VRAFNGSKVNDLDVPQEAQQWLTAELWALLAAIRGDQAAKKRITVIKLACAAARQLPRRTVFAQADTCAERTWYTRWQHQPAVKAAWAACCARALAWAERETVAQAMHDRRQRRQTTAQYAAQAPAALAAVMAPSTSSGQVTRGNGAQTASAPPRRC